MVSLLEFRTIVRFVLPILLFTATAIRAHDLVGVVQFAPPAVVVRAAYAGTEPVPFAKVQVHSPKSPQADHQAGAADVNGYFSFVPDVPGSWRLTLDDEMGHRTDVKIDVPQGFGQSVAAPPAASASRTERALTGVAFLAGLTGLLYGYRSRKR
jgi:nickel transport protein